MITDPLADAEIKAKLDHLRLLFVKRLLSDIEKLAHLADGLEDTGNTHDRQGIRHIGHSVAGAAGTFGFAEVSEYAAILEDRIDAGASDSEIVTLTRQTGEKIASHIRGR